MVKIKKEERERDGRSRAVKENGLVEGGTIFYFKDYFKLID